ncbi:MAG: DUF4959 domain-containing protein [Prevotellaceae bacterium]|jgi:hypothetical protein|nr:DUF4959 domain-containing protein [Prevotellaceae bacterium]
MKENKIKILSVLLGFTVILFFGCKEEGRLDHIDDSVPAPTAVTIETVTSKPGGAVIRYTIPNDKNLLGVKVVYERNGEICESKASKYVDTLVVEGFGSTQAQTAKLYAVGINEKLSAPVSVEIKPLAPPVQTVHFDMEEGFGGVIVSLAENDSKADLALVLMVDSTGTGQWQPLQTFHTKSAAMKFSQRNLPPVGLHFALYIRDRWNNLSDTISKKLTPIEEVKLPKDRFRNANLPGDYFLSAESPTSYPVEQVWSGHEDGSNFYASAHNGPLPQQFTIELGHKMSISRFRKWPRGGYELYSGSAPRTFELWGSDNPNPDGSYDESWHLLGRFEQFKPSGYMEGREIGTVTSEDNDYWYNRTEFELVPNEDAPDPYMVCTHLRVKTLSTFASYGTDATMGQVIIAEITFYGQLKDD